MRFLWENSWADLSTNYLFFLGELGLLPSGLTTELSEAFQRLRGVQSYPGTVEVALGALIVSLAGVLKNDPPWDFEECNRQYAGQIRDLLSRSPQAIVQKLIRGPVYPRGHLLIAERLGIIPSGVV